jgi:hypothetical protein
MFVFWYCHKRGREVRLAKEAEAEGAEGEDVLEVEVTDEEDEELEEEVAELEKEIEEKADALDQPDPTEAPVSEQGQGEKVEKSGTS